ncbi:MAG TPA: carboxypeptidase-like regulatory domain-containing protein, partial [Phnomibacter sp.]|nr:carboxypeptidase-like regulatory domain-containing protein [Phnomibacter sp.]
MHWKKYLYACTFITLLGLIPMIGNAQQASVSGKVFDEKGEVMAGVSIVILGQRSGMASSDSGTFSIGLRAGRATALVFSYAGYQTQQRNFYLNSGESEWIVVRMVPGETTLDTVAVTSDRGRREQPGLITINPKLVTQNPAPISGVESLIKVIVGSNNELTSQYNVRGGSFDENMIYVNDFEIFRPYLIRNGQQEGLSFINPDLVRNVDFFNGGFQSRYGDKMSSVLDVQYKRPSRFGGSAYVGLLDQGAHVEGSSRGDNKFTYLAGVRNRDLSNLLSAQETKGNYVPSSTDLQGLFTWQFKPDWLLEGMGNISRTQFTLEPQESQQTVSVFTPFFSANLGLDVQYEGREQDKFTTTMGGLSLSHRLKSGLRLKFLTSYLRNLENENINIAGTYLFGERSFDKASPEFGLIINPLGTGEFLNYARNQLDVQVFNTTLRGSYEKKLHYLQFAQSFEQSSIEDKLLEWQLQDSVGY